MTMLDGMRRHKGWLKWSLALVCVAFAFLYVPGFVDQTAMEGFPNDVVAQVGDQDITISEYRQLFLASLENYRRQGQDNVDEELLRSLGVDQQLLDGMITRHAAIAEAERLGLAATDTEVRRRIVNLPLFQNDGQFIGEARYRQTLQLFRPPMTPTEFEEEIRRDILSDRLRAIVTGWIAVSDDDVADEHRRRNEKVRLQVVVFRGDDHFDETEATDDEIAARYEESPLAYETPEKRQLRFLHVDEAAIFETITPTDDEVQSYYDANMAQYGEPGWVNASQILVRIGEGEEAEAEALERANDLAQQARDGADFAALAREHSEDAGTNLEGGLLGTFERGDMVAEVDAVVFALSEDEVSDPVRSSFGYHIMKVHARQEDTRQPLEAVREGIENTLKNERASARAEALGRAIAADVETPEDLEQAAAARGLELQESEFVARSEPILGLGFAPQVSAEAFGMEEGEVAGPIQTATGPAFVTVIGVEAPAVPPLEEVREDVARDVRRRKALEQARAAADAAVGDLQSAEDFEAAAAEAGLTVAGSELLTRGSAFPQVGPSAAVEQAAFDLEVGGVSGVLEAGGDTLAVVKLMEREEVTPEQLAEGADDIRWELLEDRRSDFFNAYIADAQERLGVDIDYAALAIASGAS